MRDTPSVPPSLLAALTLSGVAALAYEILWVRVLGELFGHTVYAVHVVLAVFFGGVAAGSAASDRLRLSGARLLRAYAVIEGLIAVAGLAFPHLAAAVTPLYDRLAPLELETGPAVAYRLVTATALLLIPTALMGATFPLLLRWLREQGRPPRAASLLYAANAAGGALGAWGCAFLALPRLGVSGTLLAAALSNVASAALALRLAASGGVAAPAPDPRPGAGRARRKDEGATESPLKLAPLAALFFATGLIALALEVLWSRALDQVLSGTVYSFATVLAVFLAGIALGSLWFARLSASRSPLALFVSVEVVLAVAVGGSLVILGQVLPLSDRLEAWLGLGFVRRGVVLESVLSAVVLLVPTVCMGLTFPALLALARERIGGLVAANTLGAVLGPLIAGFVLLPRLGVRGGLAVCAASALGLAFLSRRLAVPLPRIDFPLVGAAATLTLLVVAPADLRVWGRPGEVLVDHREDPAATVTVVQSPGPAGRRLKVNNTYSQGGGRAIFTERRQGHLPMLFHRNPERVLVLGVGTGHTLGALSLHEPRRLVAVELVPGVVEIARRHFGDTNHGVLSNPRVQVMVADARRVVRATPGSWDLVVADLFHPWQAGVGSLYSREHFTAVRQSLLPGGVFCQWLPLYQLSGRDLQAIVRTFLDVFPHADGWLGNFGAATPILALIGSDQEVRLRWRRWEDALASPELKDALAAVYLDRPAEVVGGFVGDRRALERLAGAGPLNLVDRPLVEFSAPSALFSETLDVSKRQSLAALIASADGAPVPVDAEGAADPPASDEVAAHLAAVRAILEAQLAMEEGRRAEALAAAVRATRLSRGYDVPAAIAAELAWHVHRELPDLAGEAFQEVLRVRPADAGAFTGLGVSYLVRDRLDDAEAAFRSALTARPGWPEAEAGMAEVARLRGAAARGPGASRARGTN
jgi:spermidine synthase